MALERVPTDVIGDDLIRTYQAASNRLTAIVRDGLQRGLDPERLGTPEQARGDATLAYRNRQLGHARAVLAELERTGPQAAPILAGRAYGAGIYAVDTVTVARRPANARMASRFGGIHQRAVNALASNMAGALEQAARTAGESVDAVFARAAALEAGVPPSGFPFVGRRQNDPWRRVALDTLGEGLVTLDTRRQVSATLARRLVDEGVTDALTGFVDRAGRRWPLTRYAAMVARTTTREATSRAAVNRMGEHGLDLVTISSHAGACEICAAYDGQTFSLSGADDRYDVLDELPPFHPNCVHVVTPAGSNLDDYEAALEDAAAGRASSSSASSAGAPPPPSSAAGAGGTPPLSTRATASHDAGTAARLEAQERRALIDADPGPNPEAELARDREHDRIARMDKRAANKYVRDELGDDLAHFTGLKWAERAGPNGESIHEAFRAGTMTTEDVEQAAYEESATREVRAVERERRANEAGFRTGPCNCFVCGHFKPRPSAVCRYCGDDPVTYGGSAQEFDRAYGYSGQDAGEFGKATHERRLGG